MIFSPLVLAALLIRVTAGILFFFQGYDKVVKIKIRGVVETVGPAYRKIGFPEGSIWFISFLTSWIEFLGGALLILGLFTVPSMMLLSLDIIIVTAGMSMLDPVHAMKLIFPRLILLLMYLLFSSANDMISIDWMLNK